MSLTIDTAYMHGRVVGMMVNYGFGMPTRLVADGDVARWCGRLVAHYGGTKALVVLGGDKHTRDELVSAALGSLDRALLERVLFRCGSVEGAGGDELIDEAVALATDEGVDFVLAIGDADTASFARELARRMAALDAAMTSVPLMDALSRRARCLSSWRRRGSRFCHHRARAAGGHRVSSA
mgnify:CR=1 FL=1